MLSILFAVELIILTLFIIVPSSPGYVELCVMKQSESTI